MPPPSTASGAAGGTALLHVEASALSSLDVSAASRTAASAASAEDTEDTEASTDIERS